MLRINKTNYDSDNLIIVRIIQNEHIGRQSQNDVIIRYHAKVIVRYVLVISVSLHASLRSGIVGAHLCEAAVSHRCRIVEQNNYCKTIPPHDT